MTIALTTAASLLTVIIGALLAYRYNDTLHRRQQWLARVNLQLAEFYGPLYAIAATSGSTYEHFRSMHRPNVEEYFDGPPLTQAEIEAWKRWLHAVFMPKNRRMHEIIMTKSHLIIEDSMPKPLMDLCAHVSAWEAVMWRWSNGDYSQLDADCPWPRGFVTYIDNSFNVLKSRQLQLLILVQPAKSLRQKIQGRRRHKK